MDELRLLGRGGAEPGRAKPFEAAGPAGDAFQAFFDMVDAPAALCDPSMTLLTVDATTGQNGLRQARLFAEVAPVTGIVLTKLDGTAKGGIALAIARDLGIPVKLIGIGEQLEDLRPFDAHEYAQALLAP